MATLASVAPYAAVVEMVFGVGLRHRDNSVSTVCETHLRETGDVHSSTS